MSKYKLYNDDCFNILKTLPDRSVNLVLCDLPYGLFEEGASGNWHRGEELRSWDSILDTNKLFEEYERLLVNNGRLVLFCQGAFVAELINNQRSNLRFCQKLIWLKDTSGSILGCKKQFVGFYEDICVFNERFEDNSKYNFIGELLENEIIKNGFDRKKLYEIFGRTVQHWFSKGLQCRLPTKEKWDKLIEIGAVKDLDYNTLKRLINDNERKCTFNLLDGENLKSNVLRFNKDKEFYHPTQKPIKLLEYLILTYSNEGDLVLDNTMGSGSTGVACMNVNRDFIGIEKIRSILI